MDLKKVIVLVCFFTGASAGCGNTPPQPLVRFGEPVKVTINGYSGNMMEPFISRDGNYLLFNNLNAAPENTNLHYAKRISDTEFNYLGEIMGVNTASIEGTPTMDKSNNLYFISGRSYSTTLSTVYYGLFAAGSVTSLDLVIGIPATVPGTVIFDIEVDGLGSTLYFSEGVFDSSGNPETADIVIAKRSGSGFERFSNSAEILKNINSGQLEYAASISSDGLELFFTRVPVVVTSTSLPRIYVSSRTSVNDVFDPPTELTMLTGFVEAAALSAD